MKNIVVYDSAYGNTRLLARIIAQHTKSKLRQVIDVKDNELRSLDLLIVGSPTQGGQPTATVLKFIKELPEDVLTHTCVAVFDTRFAINEHGRGLRFVMRTVGFAAPKMAAVLEQKGGILLAKPQGFIVEEKEGPIKDNEPERARAWAKKIYQKMLEPQLAN